MGCLTAIHLWSGVSLTIGANSLSARHTWYMRTSISFTQPMELCRHRLVWWSQVNQPQKQHRRCVTYRRLSVQNQGCQRQATQTRGGRISPGLAWPLASQGYCCEVWPIVLTHHAPPTMHYDPGPRHIHRLVQHR